MSVEIILEAGANGFAENKDEAREIRVTRVLPALESGDKVVLDFGAIRYATQSFVHALFAEALQRYGERVLDSVEFRNCSPGVRSVIELVVDYTLGGFAEKRGA